MKSPPWSRVRWTSATMGPEGRRPRRDATPARPHREDGADRAVDIQVRGAIHRVAADDQAARTAGLVDLDRILGLLGDEGGDTPAGPEPGQHRLVAPDIELLDLVTTDIRAPGIAEAVTEGGVRELLGDDGGDAPDPAHDRRDAERVLGREEGLLGNHVLG